MRISDWSSDVCSSDLGELATGERRRHQPGDHRREPERHFVVEAAVGVAEERSGIAEVHPPGVAGKAHAAVEVDRAVVDRARDLVDAAVVGEGIVEEERTAERTRSEEHTSELLSQMRTSYA